MTSVECSVATRAGSHFSPDASLMLTATCTISISTPPSMMVMMGGVKPSINPTTISQWRHPEAAQPRRRIL
jgi:hypothetical protein